MNVLLEAHPASVFLVMTAMMVTPLHLLATYVFSGASARKGMAVAAAWLAWGAVMSVVCLWELPEELGPFGALVVPAAWITPSLILVLGRRWFLSQPLDQRWLVGLQVWRVIGAAFLFELALGNLPGIFAYPAGV